VLTFPDTLPVAHPLLDAFPEGVETKNGEGLAERLPPNAKDTEDTREAEGWGELEEVGAIDSAPLPVPPMEGEGSTEGVELPLPSLPLLLPAALNVAPSVALEDPLQAEVPLPTMLCEDSPLGRDEGEAGAEKAAVLVGQPVWDKDTLGEGEMEGEEDTEKLTRALPVGAPGDEV
jgi:hypothetical protein